jgi:hypothetical protein
VTAKFLKTFAICIPIVLVAIVANAQDAKPKTFSADFTLTSPKSDKLMTGRFYFAPPKARIDINDVQNKASAAVILDYDKNSLIAILPQFHTYTETSIDPKNSPEGSMGGPDFLAADPCVHHADWKCKKTGIDTLDGRKCDVWDIMANDSDHDTEWVDQKLNFPIKYRRADGTSLEYTNIQEGQQPAPSLFQVPAGYRKNTPNGGSKPPAKKGGSDLSGVSPH